MTASETLAAFVAKLHLDDASQAIVDKLKDHLLDTIGVACAGLTDPTARRVVDVVQRWGGATEAGVIGLPMRLPAPRAAFVNALHARVHTFDDVYEVGPVHPGCAVVAAALAAAERAQVSGKTLLAALLAGYESATRVSKALGAGHYGAGFHSTGTATPFGAAAAAARAWSLDAARTAAAFGLAGEGTLGLRQYQLDGSMLDTALNGARGAEAGVVAASFAAADATGPRGILDGRWGMLRVMSGSDADALTADLGTRWEFADMTLKAFASCRFTHGPIEALRAARLDPKQVDRVEIVTFRASVEVSDRPRPRDRMEAILSHQLAAALALLDKPIVPQSFDTRDDAVSSLAERVSVRHDPSLDAAYPARWPHRIVVTMRSGEQVELQSDQPPTADRAAVRGKYRALAAPVLGETNSETILAAIDGLERMPDVSPLLQRLGCGPAKTA